MTNVKEQIEEFAQNFEKFKQRNAPALVVLWR